MTTGRKKEIQSVKDIIIDSVVEDFPGFTPSSWIDMLRVYQVLIRTFVYNIAPIILQILAFIEYVINIFCEVVSNLTIYIVPDFHPEKSVAGREPIMVDKPEEGFNFGGDFCFPNPRVMELCLRSLSLVPASILYVLLLENFPFLVIFQIRV